MRELMCMVGLAALLLIAGAIELVAAQGAPVSIDIATLRHAPPAGLRARFEGFVIDSYRCPPCPRGALCKPCVMHSAIFVADTKEHAQFSWSDPPADVAVIGVDDPAQFSKGVRYRFEVQVLDKGRAGDIDATLIRSQRADEPIWAEPAPVGSQQPGMPR